MRQPGPTHVVGFPGLLHGDFLRGPLHHPALADAQVPVDRVLPLRGQDEGKARPGRPPRAPAPPLLRVPGSPPPCSPQPDASLHPCSPSPSPPSRPSARPAPPDGGSGRRARAEELPPAGALRDAMPGLVPLFIVGLLAAAAGARVGDERRLGAVVRGWKSQPCGRPESRGPLGARSAPLTCRGPAPCGGRGGAHRPAL